MVFGHLPRGPLAVLKETWTGEVDLPFDLDKNVVDYMRELRDKLCVAENYTASHSDRAQTRYVTHYNLRSQDKHFSEREQVLILSPDSTARQAAKSLERSSDSSQRELSL